MINHDLVSQDAFAYQVYFSQVGDGRDEHCGADAAIKAETNIAHVLEVSCIVGVTAQL